MHTLEMTLLHLVVESPCQLNALLSNECAESRGQEPFQATSSELKTALSHLFVQGYIVATQFDNGSHQGFDPWGLPLKQVRDNFMPTNDEVEAALQGHLTMTYRLTITGGQQWEQAFQADWTRYIDETYTSEYPYRGEVIAGSREMLEQFLVLATAIKYPSCSPIKAGSIIQDEIAPWQATYWKVLAKGYRATFSCHPADDSFYPGENLFPLDTLRTWYSVPADNKAYVY